MNKHWKEELNKNNKLLYILYFEPFGDKEELIRFTKDEDGCYVYSSKILSVEYDWLNELDEVFSIEDVKKMCEIMIEEYYEYQISYYEELLRLFREE